MSFAYDNPESPPDLPLRPAITRITLSPSHSKKTCTVTKPSNRSSASLPTVTVTTGMEPLTQTCPSTSAKTSKVKAKQTLKVSERQNSTPSSQRSTVEFNFEPDEPVNKIPRMSEPVSKSSKFFSSKRNNRPKVAYAYRPWNSNPDMHEQEEDDKEEPASTVFAVPSKPAVVKDGDDVFAVPQLPSRLTKSVSTGNMAAHKPALARSCTVPSDVPSVKIRHVKDASEVCERGEQQGFADELEYLVDGLSQSQPCATRVLSLLQLVEKCASSHDFRLHLKTHRLHPKIFKLLTDSNEVEIDPTLSLAAAALFYTMSRDRSTLLLDRNGLRLLLLLLSTNERPKQTEKVRLRLKCVIQTDAAIISVAELLHSPRKLALLALLSLGIRRASAWFKEEIRLTHGLDHTLMCLDEDLNYFGDELTEQILNEFMLIRLRRIELYLHLLENMTFQCGENQAFIAQWSNRLLPQSLLPRLLTLTMANCSEDLESPVSRCLLGCIKLLLNVTHNNLPAAEATGRCDSLLDILMKLVDPESLPATLRFDCALLALGCLINLTEYSEENQRRLAHHPNAVETLVSVFNERFQRAASHELEKALDDSPPKRVSRNFDQEVERPSSPQDIDLDVDTGASGPERPDLSNPAEMRAALSRAGEHLEDSCVAGYAGLVICCLVQSDRGLALRLRVRLKPQPSLLPVLSCITKLLSFMSLSQESQTQESQTKSIVRLLTQAGRMEDMCRDMA